jgi:hypothetical protein
VITRAVTALVFFAVCGASSVYAQTTYSPVVITPPIVDSVDENNVSILTGKIHYSIPAVALGDVSFAPFTTNNQFDKLNINDSNYGHVQVCLNPQATTSYTSIADCVSAQASLYAIYGEERSAFQYNNGQYIAVNFDGSTFTDNGSTCTWTRHDGTQIVYAAFHTSGSSLCQSNNISKIVHPDGRIETYYYYGSSTTPTINWTPTPILSIASNSGYLLKYIYSGTPAWGAETSVVAINRAFEFCDPTALSCTLANQWPTATVSWVDKPLSSPDDLLAAPDKNLHYMFTIIDQAHRQHVFELDSIFRVISYQPPEATTPLITYSLCSVYTSPTIFSHPLANCWGRTTWTYPPNGGFDYVPVMLDLVSSATRNGLSYTYNSNFYPGGGLPAYSTWYHGVTNPLGQTMQAAGNATPGTEYSYGPVEYIKHYDGTTDYFEHDTQNYLQATVSALGLRKVYGWDGQGNLLQIYENPVGSTTDSMLVRSAHYPSPCVLLTCNKPDTVTDGNGNAAHFVYDPNHGGVLTATGPLVSVTDPTAPPVSPQNRYTYIQRNAWYLSSPNVMARDPNPIWVRATESACRETAAASSGSGCSGSDEVLTTYDYGPDSGPNNLLVRGKTVAADQQVLRTCYIHDKQGNTISEISPNAGRASCPDY